MFNSTAILVDGPLGRSAFLALVLVACALLGPLSILLLSYGAREPLLFLIGVGGIAGLGGAWVRLIAGSRFFHLPRWARLSVACCIGAGIAAAFAGSIALPERIYWFTLIALVGFAGILLLGGSLHKDAPGA